jgi:hypothetical protein
MPGMQLPFSPDGVEHITPELAFEKRDGRLIYYKGTCRCLCKSDLRDRQSVSAAVRGTDLVLRKGRAIWGFKLPFSC